MSAGESERGWDLGAEPEASFSDEVDTELELEISGEAVKVE